MKKGNEFSRWLTSILSHFGHDTTTKRASVMGWTPPMQFNLESGLRFPDQDRLTAALKRLNLSEEEIKDGVILMKRAKAEAKA